MTIREVIDTYPKDEACFMLSRCTPEKLESEYAIHLKNAEDCPNLRII